MNEDRENPVSRWSRLKQQQRDQQRPGPEAASQAPPTGGDLASADTAAEAQIVEQLPDIDTLEEGSDFTVFLKEGVPDALRRRALRKLWRLNPVFANLDGLNDYDEDFTIVTTLAENLKTVYQVGKGMPDPESAEEQEQLEGQEGDQAATGRPPGSADPEPPREGDGPETPPAGTGNSDDAPDANESPGVSRSMAQKIEPEPTRMATGNEANRPTAADRRWERFKS